MLEDQKIYLHLKTGRLLPPPILANDGSGLRGGNYTVQPPTNILPLPRTVVEDISQIEGGTYFYDASSSAGVVRSTECLLSNILEPPCYRCREYQHYGWNLVVCTTTRNRTLETKLSSGPKPDNLHNFIHFQLTAMAPKGSRKGKGKATAGAKMPTSVINRRLSLDRDRIKGFISEHIRGLIRIWEPNS
ncbi:hypothetical protein K440DRAFT_310592 [Wilcoxina mikolae CBS 423.85]|nr:hypothetical protein K440DRAFT_310592 [Wilcoxina mikolae CBS 423.85]